MINVLVVVFFLSGGKTIEKHYPMKSFKDCVMMLKSSEIIATGPTLNLGYWKTCSQKYVRTKKKRRKKGAKYVRINQ